MRFLEGWLRNVEPHVDGIVALDDGSCDGSAELLDRSPAVIELIRRPRERPVWDEMANHRDLVAASLAHGAEWIVALDADERVEHEFRDRTERLIRRWSRFGCTAFGLRLRELWDSPESFRTDGVWGRKRCRRLFRAHPDHQFDTAFLHGSKAPLQARFLGGCPLADLTLYHLRMVDPADRAARRQRYESLDPTGRWQIPPIGYAYLTDETGLTLEPVPAGRGFVE